MFLRALRFLPVLPVILLIAHPAAAQSIQGRVVDPQDRPVAIADVLVLQGTAVVTTVRTSTDGRFGPVAIAAGEYEVLVAASGFRSDPKRVTVGAASAANVDVKLTLGAVNESVVVSAAQVDLPLSRVTDSVTVVERADLRALQTEVVSEAVRRTPGFHVVQSGGRGALTSFFPRGGESDYTLVLTDGIPLNAFGGGFDAAHLSAAEVERIEIVRGPQSALYGNGAIGGIVHVVTPHGGPPRLNATFEGGGYGTMRFGASTAGTRQHWTWGATVDRLKTDGDTRHRENLGTRVANDDYERLSGTVSLAWSDRAERRVRVDVLASHNERGFPGPYGSDPEGRYGGLDLVSRGTGDTRGVRASAIFGAPRSFRHSLTFALTDAAGEFKSPGFFDPTIVNTFSTDTARLTGRYQLDLERARFGLSAGWEFLFEQEDNSSINDEASDPIPVEREVSGWFVETRWPLRGRGALNAGVRFERIQRTALAAGEFGRPALEDDVVWSANPKVSAAWFVRPPDARGWTKLRVGAGTGIKPPTAFEIAFSDNPALKPERSRSFDAGIEQALGGSSFVADATFFANRYDDLIVTIGRTLQGASRYQSDNVANASAKGLEVGVTWRSARGFSARAGWTWLDTEVLGVDNLTATAPPPYAVGDSLLRRPAQQASAEILWSSARGQAFLAINGRGKMSDFEPSFASSVYTNPGYAVASLGGSVRITRGLDAYVRVTNLFDENYEEAFGFPALGRSAMVGVRVAAGR